MILASDIVNYDGRGDILDFLIEVEIDEPKRDSFLKIKETLSRIGISSKSDDKTLYQSCHILQKRARYFIVGFKVLFVLDGRRNDITRGDVARQNRIALLLEEWGLLRIKNPHIIADCVSGLSNMMIVPFREKSGWDLRVKYQIGKRNV